MSVTGPGCAACDFKATVPWSADRPHSLKPCDRCGGWSQFAVVVPLPDIASSPADEQPTDAELALMFADDSTAPSPEADWRSLPSCAEVLAHNARTGSDRGPWLALRRDPLERVEVVYVGGYANHVAAYSFDGEPIRLAVDDPKPLMRPITRRGEALPWPEVPR